jgi:DHA2 family multidrug resistance protein
MNTRLHFHWSRLIEHINPARPAVQQFLETHTNRLDPLTAGDPAHAALKLLANTVQREALVLTYNDALMLLGVGFAIGLFLMPLVKAPRSALAADRH